MNCNIRIFTVEAKKVTQVDKGTYLACAQNWVQSLTPTHHHKAFPTPSTANITWSHQALLGPSTEKFGLLGCWNCPQTHPPATWIMLESTPIKNEQQFHVLRTCLFLLFYLLPLRFIYTIKNSLRATTLKHTIFEFFGSAWGLLSA